LSKLDIDLFRQNHKDEYADLKQHVLEFDHTDARKARTSDSCMEGDYSVFGIWVRN